jgi:hypothetical protein
MEATREGLNTGVLASMSIIERIQKVFKDMGLNGTDTIDQLRDDVAACRLVLGQAIDFAKMADQVAAQRPNVN